MLNVLGSVAQFERAMGLEGQRDGIARAKQEGRYEDRALTAMGQAQRIKELAAQGMTRRAVAKALSVCEPSVYPAISA